MTVERAMRMNQPLPVAVAGTSLQWHEAVAIVHEVADALADGRLGSVPRAGRIALEPDGSLFCGGGAVARRVSRDVTATEIVDGLKRLLGELLETNAPAELRELAESAPPGAAAPGLEPFTRALAFFERPSRHHDLEALAGRLREALEKRELEAELERLTRKARDDEPEPPHATPDTEAGARQRSRRSPLLLAAVAAAVALAAGAALIVAWPAARSSRVALVATELPKSAIGKLRAAAASTLPPHTEREARSNQPTTKRPEPRRQRPRDAARAPARAAVPSSRPEAGIYRAVQPDLIEVFVSDPDEAGLPRAAPTVYDGTNPDVVPAILLRPRLPAVSASAVLKGQLGKLDVLVGRDGHVEQVRLLATSVERRYYDAMILPAVKAWVFQPATRDGRAVRYRLEVLLP